MTLADLLAQTEPALIGLVGVVLGSILTSRHLKRERRQRLVRDQLVEFYAPMLGIRERLRAKGETRVKVSAAARVVWPKLIEQARASSVEHGEKVRKELGPQFEKIIEYNNNQLMEEELPLYRKMIDVFTTRMHLADISTRQHFSALVEFVELWDRSLGGTLPREVAEQVAADEEKLMPFYGDRVANFERLQTVLKE
jgi:hypothetical protein